MEVKKRRMVERGMRFPEFIERIYSDFLRIILALSFHFIDVNVQ